MFAFLLFAKCLYAVESFVNVLDQVFVPVTLLTGMDTSSSALSYRLGRLWAHSINQPWYTVVVVPALHSQD